MVGDYIKGLKVQKEPLYRKVPIYFLTYLNEFMQNIAIKKCTTFVNSRLLFNKYKDQAKTLHEIRTTTLTLKDFYQRYDSFDNSNGTVNILSTGRISYEKGVIEVVRVAAKLTKEGLKINVHFVGWEDKVDKPVERDIKAEAVRLGISDRVYLHGKKNVGPELFEMYRMSQIFMLPSQSDFEGFPRTVWEAMANCVSVITTGVGSIPFFIENNKHALIVPPRDFEALFSATKRIINDQSLRKLLLSNAFSYVKDITLEIQTKRMLNLLSRNDV